MIAQTKITVNDFDSINRVYAEPTRDVGVVTFNDRHQVKCGWREAYAVIVAMREAGYTMRRRGGTGIHDNCGRAVQS